MVSSGGPTTPARYFTVFGDWLKSIGVNVDRVLESAHIEPGTFYRPGAELSLAQIDSFLNEAMDATGRPDLGFDFGRQVKLSTHEILGFAMLSSQTLDCALRLTSRYYRLITPTFRMSYRRSQSCSEIEFSPMLSLRPETLRFFLEAIAVATHEHVKGLLGGDMRPYEIYTSIPQPAYCQRYRELTPACWHFEALDVPGIRMELSADDMDRPLAMADRSALHMAQTRCDELLQRMTQDASLGEWVAMMLREAHDNMPTLDDLALILHVTSRTLDRRLRKEGQQFLDIAKRVRLERATELLRSSRLSVTQVALQLGYKDVANFTRAFRRDSGMSPSEFLVMVRTDTSKLPRH